MADCPLGRSESPDPEALHVEDGAGVHDELAVVALRDRAQVMAEQNRRRLFH